MLAHQPGHLARADHEHPLGGEVFEDPAGHLHRADAGVGRASAVTPASIGTTSPKRYSVVPGIIAIADRSAPAWGS
ncbi:MAG: hypothetical protein ACOCTI_00420 [Phycisphaeraceae bacterium]